MDPDPPLALAWAPVPPGTPRRDVAWRILRELAGTGVTIANPCPRCGGPHGPVVLVGDARRASVSYSGSLAFAAVAPLGVAALGIDAEPEDRDTAGVNLGGPATVRDWVRVEAVLKADGRGLSLDPAAVGIRRDAHGRSTARLGPRGSERQYRVVDLAGPPGHLVSAAYAGE